MKGQQITPWSIYNYNFGQGGNSQKNKNSTQRVTPQSKIFLPTLKNTTEVKTVFLKNKIQNPIVSRFINKKEKLMNKHQQQLTQKYAISLKKKRQVSNQNKKERKNNKQKTQESLFDQKNIEKVQELDKYTRLLRQKLVLKIIRKTLHSQTQVQRSRKTMLHKAYFSEDSIPHEQHLYSIKGTTKMNINRLPEVEAKRIHEGKNILDSDTIKVILKHETKRSIARRMQFLWKNRSNTKNNKW